MSTGRTATRHLDEIVRRPLDPPFSRVLVGVDGTAEAEEAVRQGACLAAQMEAGLELVHVFDLAAERGAVAEEARRRVDEMLAEAVRLAGTEEAEASTRMLIGDPPALLDAQARQSWADLLCVGGRAFPSLGRVSRSTLRRVSCSVLIARPPPREKPFPRRVLCAVDGSAGSVEAARQAGGVAALAGCSLRLLHVVNGSAGPEGFRGGEAALDEAAAAAATWGVSPTREMTIGPAGPAIREIAEGSRADLLVVGSRGLRGIGRLLLGSVSDWVSANAPCSVLVARPRPG